MKKIIPPAAMATEINADQLNGSENVAYQGHNSDNVKILVRLNKGYPGKILWGFVPVLKGNGDPTYVHDNFYASVTAAMKSRKVFVYDTIEDLIKISKGNG